MPACPFELHPLATCIQVLKTHARQRPVINSFIFSRNKTVLVDLLADFKTNQGIANLSVETAASSCL